MNSSNEIEKIHQKEQTSRKKGKQEGKKEGKQEGKQDKYFLIIIVRDNSTIIIICLWIYIKK